MPPAVAARRQQRACSERAVSKGADRRGCERAGRPRAGVAGADSVLPSTADFCFCRVWCVRGRRPEGCEQENLAVCSSVWTSGRVCTQCCLVVTVCTCVRVPSRELGRGERSVIRGAGRATGLRAGRRREERRGRGRRRPVGVLGGTRTRHARVCVVRWTLPHRRATGTTRREHARHAAGGMSGLALGLVPCARRRPPRSCPRCARLARR